MGIGGAVWLVLSVQTVREDELEARLVVETECRMKLERCLFAFESSLSFSLVVRDEEEMIDRRFVRLRSLLPSSASSLPLFSVSSPPEEEGREGGDEEGYESETVSGS